MRTIRLWIKLLDFTCYWSGAAAVAGIIGAGASVAAGVKQEKAREDAEAEQRRLEQDAMEQEQRIFEQRAENAENQGKATVEFGADDDDKPLGSYDDFLTPLAPAKNAGLGSAGKQTSSLGFAL